MADLFDPMPLGSVGTARNRIWLAPMTNQQSGADGVVSTREIDWLEARAKGGFGVIETAAAHVLRDGQGWPGELGAFDEALIPGLRALAARLHDHGARAILQLVHTGARAPVSLVGEPWSASAIALAEGQGRVAREATEFDIEDVITAFAHAARRAVEAGFDGVEIHGAHGYLLTQFMSATTNQRADAWGGDVVGRSRLLREVTRAVRASVGDRLLCVRISPESYGSVDGLDLDESLWLAQELAALGMDVLHLSLWDASAMSKKRPDQHPVTAFREVLGPETPIVVAGGIETVAQAQNLLDLGAGAVALGRIAIGNADWPLRAQVAGWEPVRSPFTRAHLASQAVSAGFADYLTKFRAMVAD